MSTTMTPPTGIERVEGAADTTSIDRLFGARVRRKEDPRFLTGRGQYTDDVRITGTIHAAFVRSPHAHAHIRNIDLAAARAHPGVVAVYTGKDLADAGVNGIPVGWLPAGAQAEQPPRRSPSTRCATSARPSR